MHLLKYFKAMSLRPENAKEIRALILELAIRGRLTEEWRRDNPDVESASVLLEQIREEKARLVKEKIIRKEKALPEIEVGRYSFPIPQNWNWCRLRDIGVAQTGSTPSKNNIEYWGDFIPFVNPGNISSTGIELPDVYLSKEGLEKGRLIPQKSLLMVCIGGSIGKCGINKIDVSCNQQINTLTPIQIDVDLVKILCEADYFQKELVRKASGSATPIINKGKWESIIIPLPPLPEQKAIVTTVNRLLAEVDELEQQTTRFQALRQDYVTASLRALTGEDSGEAWAELRPHFQSFFNQENGVKKLREAVLELAVQGKLTARWRAKNPDVEPAGVLLERIGVEKARLVREKVIRKQKEQPIIDPAPYHIPKKWAWTRMQSITTLVTDGTHHTPTYIDEGVPFLSVKNLSRGKLEFTNTRFISQDEHEKLIRRCNPEKGDVLLTKVGTTGIAVTVDTDKAFSIFVSVALLKLVQNTVRPSFLELLINSPFVKYQSSEGTQGVGNKNLVLRTIKSFILPLPPLPEQRAIVKIVDELMALCDRLAEKIEQREIIGNDFLRSSVRELLVATEAVAI
jgi:type I restriction enzyme S subunit